MMKMGRHRGVGQHTFDGAEAELSCGRNKMGVEGEEVSIGRFAEG